MGHDALSTRRHLSPGRRPGGGGIPRPGGRRAGIPDRAEVEGGAGMHQLRHHFASLLLRGGVDIKRVQEWLGRHSAAFTLDIYRHLMPDDHEASLRQVEAISAAALRSAPDGPRRPSAARKAAESAFPQVR